MLLTIVAVGVSVLWTLGLYSLLGYSYNVLASMLVPLIVVLAIADDVHIMQHWDEERRHRSAEASFKVAHLATPLFGASATPALGMASLATSSVVAVRSFGIGSAVGIMIDFMISLVFVPTLLSLMKPEMRETPHEKYLVQPMRRIAMFSTRHPREVIAATVVLSLVASYGIRNLHVDTNHINFFSASHPLGQSARVIDGQLSGIYSFQIMLEGQPESLGTPGNLQRMDRLENELRTFPNVKKESDGKYHIYHVNNGESGWDTNDTPNEISGMRTAFTTAIQASTILGTDAELRGKWQEMLDNLAPPGNGGQGRRPPRPTGGDAGAPGGAAVTPATRPANVARANGGGGQRGRGGGPRAFGAFVYGGPGAIPANEPEANLKSRFLGFNALGSFIDEPGLNG
jgi:predicted RND superfamily exporter protein